MFPSSGDYVRVGVRTGLEMDEWSFSVYGKNLTNEDDSTLDRISVIRVAPRELGFELGYSF